MRQARSRLIRDQVKDRYADRVITTIESYAPGLSKDPRTLRCSRPSISERENPNLVGGDQICGSHHLSQISSSPGARFAGWNTPVERLHLVGAAMAGAGVGAASGFMLAQQLGGGRRPDVSADNE